MLGVSELRCLLEQRSLGFSKKGALFAGQWGKAGLCCSRTEVSPYSNRRGRRLHCVPGPPQGAVDDPHEVSMEAVHDPRNCQAPAPTGREGICCKPLPCWRRKYCSEACLRAARSVRRSTPRARALNRAHQRNHRSKYPDRRKLFRAAKTLYRLLRQTRPDVRERYFATLGVAALADYLDQSDPAVFWKAVIRPSVLEGAVPVSGALPVDVRKEVRRVLHFIGNVAVRRYLTKEAKKGGSV